MQSDLVRFKSNVFLTRIEGRNRRRMAHAHSLGSVGSVGKTVLGAHFKSTAAAQQFSNSLPSVDLKDSIAFNDSGKIYLTPPAPPIHQPPSQSSFGFDPERYMSHLGSSSLGHILLTAEELPSTQEFMRRHGVRLGEGVVTVADRQSSGKGRGGNSWTSPDGCLMFSVGQKLKVQGAQAPFINYVVSLAVVRGIHDAIRAVAPELLSSVDVRIKWPNDIYTSTGLKIGGVLIHTTWSSDRFNVVTGIGLNVSNRQPTACLEEMLIKACGIENHLEKNSGTQSSEKYIICRATLLACILNQLEACFQVFELNGFAPLEKEYLSLWLHSGQRVVAYDPQIAPAGENLGHANTPPTDPLPLMIKGLSVQGFLLAEDDLGRHYELTPDGNSLDMMKGLIKRKVPSI